MNMGSVYLQRWPGLAVLAQQPGPVYILLTPQQLEQACASGEREFGGQNLVLTRLDMALSGLMQKLAAEFFLDDFFPSRLTAAVEILLAARVYLEQEEPADQAEQRRLRLLAEETCEALSQWESLLNPAGRQTLLYAAEERAEISE